MVERICEMKRQRFTKLLLLAAMLFLGANLAMGEDGEKLTNKQIMAKINGPKGVFASVKKDLAQADPDWVAITKESKAIVALTEGLAVNMPKKGDQASWEKLTAGYTKSAKALADASDKMDLKSARAAQQALGTACTGCHRVHK
jgi:hypothetical protein